MRQGLRDLNQTVSLTRKLKFLRNLSRCISSDIPTKANVAVGHLLQISPFLQIYDKGLKVSDFLAVKLAFNETLIDPVG